MARDPDFDRISKKAHELWEADGRPHGRDQDHWDQAREIIAIKDSQHDTLLPRDTGAVEPIEDAEVALRNMADVPNLTDQGENLLTSTDREPDLTATPSGKTGRMPKVEVPISDQPGIPPKIKKVDAKSNKSDAVPKSATPKGSPKPASTASAPPVAAAESKPASVPTDAKPETVKSAGTAKKPGASTKRK